MAIAPVGLAMMITELCTRDVVVADRFTPITDAAKLMRAYHVGDLVIVEERDNIRYPVGIITDRDLVVGALADHAEKITKLTLNDVMTRDLVTIAESKDVHEALKTMRTHGIRRVPVVGTVGELIGVVSFDDIVELIAEEMSDLATLLAREQKHEKELRDPGIQEGSRATRH